MLLNDEQLNTRLASPDNLINRLRNTGKSNGLQLLGVEKPSSSRSTPVIGMPEQNDVEKEIETALVKVKARKILGDSLDLLSVRLGEVEKPETLSRVAGDMGKLIESFEPKKESHGNSQIIVWKPMIFNESQYESVIAYE